MSSDYYPICLNHDPGIVIDHDFTYEEANSLSTRDRLSGHENCDIVIGRYSAPLVEVACLGRQLAGPTGCKAYHIKAMWIDRDWLRLLATAGPDAHPGAMGALSERGCWPLERVHRLRVELDMPEMAAASGPAPCRSRSSGDQGWPCTLPNAHGGEHRSVQPGGTSYWQDRPIDTEG